MARVLVVDPDAELGDLMAHVLGDSHAITHLPRIPVSLTVIESLQPQLIFLGVDRRGDPDPTRIRALHRVLAAPIVCIGHNAPTSAVVRALRSGATDFLQMPFAANELRRAAACAVASDPGEQRDVAQSELGLVGVSDEMRAVRRQIIAFGPRSAPVLVLGESGTGKELVARALHAVSRHKHGPFVARNCGAIPEQLFETEMFGAEKGAYTGAIRRDGAFELANQGTLFLDEIGELPHYCQVKLLRALESGTIHRVGASATIELRLRFVAATNKNLARMVAAGAFREDLYYRIGVMGIWIPPLRDREQDIPLLAEHFFTELLCAEPDLSCPGFTARALQRLRRHHWPGNVRELRNVVQRSAILAGARQVDTDDLIFELAEERGRGPRPIAAAERAASIGYTRPE